MSKDRYSNNHTIQVVGDTRTIILDRNVEVENDLEVGNDLTVTGTITVPSIVLSDGDLELTGDLDVDGTATINDLVITGSNERSVAESISFNFAASAFVPLGNWGAAFTHLVDSAGDGVEVPAGDSLSAAHSLAVLPNGSTIDNLHIRYTPEAPSGYSVSASIMSRGKILGNVSTVATVTAIAGNDGIYNIESETNIGQVINTATATYWLIFEITAPGADSLELHQVDIDCDVLEYS